jgi:transcriptional regulator with XRE-family HTH domain
MADMPQDTSAPHTEEPTAQAGTGPEGIVVRRVRDLRTKAGLTQSQMAAEMTARGFSMVQSTIANIEAGHRPVRLNEAVALAAVVGAELPELLLDPIGDSVHQARIETQARIRGLRLLVAERRADVEAAMSRMRLAREQLAQTEAYLAELDAGRRFPDTSHYTRVSYPEEGW